MRLHADEASPLVSVSIAGKQNQMADSASCTFSRQSATSDTFQISDSEFLHSFSTAFPLQADYWRIFRLGNKLALAASLLQAKRRVINAGVVEANN
jgi:hypothetical protein